MTQKKIMHVGDLYSLISSAIFIFFSYKKFTSPAGKEKVAVAK